VTSSGKDVVVKGAGEAEEVEYNFGDPLGLSI